MINFSRRKFSQMALMSLPFIGACKRRSLLLPNESPLVVTSYGGSWQTAERSAFFDPFTAATDIAVHDLTYGGDLTQISTMVETGHVAWDVVDVETYMLLQGAAQGLYEPIDYTAIAKDHLFPQAIHPNGVAICFWSTVLGYNTQILQRKANGLQPTGWHDFWDQARFPGPRALRRSPVSTLEISLLADGVPSSHLYPLDVDRAFRSLDRIKPYVTVWWEAGEQPALLLSSGEVAMASVWNGRIQHAQSSGQPVNSIWNGGLLDADWWVIPRGTKKKDTAQRFIAFTEMAKQQAAYPPLIAYGPTRTDAFDLLPDAIRKDLPTDQNNIRFQSFINGQWWQANLSQVQQRWEEWLIK